MRDVPQLLDVAILNRGNRAQAKALGLLVQKWQPFQPLESYEAPAIVAGAPSIMSAIMMTMERTTISLPHELIVRLRVMAAQRRVSMAQVIREALEEKARPIRAKPTFIGIADSGHTDTSQIASEGPVPPVSWR